MKKKILAILLSTVLAATALAGCGNKQTKSDELEDFSIVLDWYPNAVHAFIYEAIDKGYYKEEGLNVKVQFPSNANDAISLTAAGKADAGIYYLQDIITTRGNQDIPVVSIGSIVQSPLSIILSLKDKNITSPKDLEGKKVGYGGTELSESIIQFMLKEAGCDPKKVELIDVGFDLMSSMTTGNVDATLGCLVNHEVPAMEKEGFEVNYFSPTEYGVPNYYELVIITGEQTLAQDKDKLTKFLRASKKGFEDMKNDPKEALDILLEYQNQENFPLDKEVETKSFETILPLMETKDSPFLSQDEAVWQTNIDWLKEQGLLKTEMKATDMFVNILDE